MILFPESINDVIVNTDISRISTSIQGVSEIRVLILTSGRTRQFMKLFSITFWQNSQDSKIFCPQIFTKRVFLYD
jgi:hypothetical protein